MKPLATSLLLLWALMTVLLTLLQFIGWDLRVWALDRLLPYQIERFNCRSRTVVESKTNPDLANFPPNIHGSERYF